MPDDFIPKETEKISVRRAARIAQKIKEARLRVLSKKAWWSDTPLEVFSLIILFFLNFYLLYPFFGTQAVDIPYSGPIIPIMAKFISFISKIPLLYSFQLIYIIFFLVFPFSFYFLVKKITDRKLAAILAVLLVSLPIEPFGRIRIEAMFANFDAPHIVSISVIPLALYGLLSFLKEGRAMNFLVASSTAALIALISPFGFMIYIVMACIFTFSEVLLEGGKLKIFRFLLILLIAGGLNAFWYNPSFFFWMITGPLGENIRSTVSKLIPISFFAIPVFATFGYLLFDRKPSLQSVFIAGFCSIAFLIITLVGEGVVPSGPSRYLTELGISLSLLFGLLIVKIFDYFKFSLLAVKLPKKIGNVLVDTLCALTICFLIFAIIVGRENSVLPSQDVLGMWTDIERGEIWLARDDFNGIHSVFGLIITSVTVGGMYTITKKEQKQYKNLNN